MGRSPPISEELKAELVKEYTLKAELVKEYTIMETRRALTEMGSMKAPGPDSYQSIFFKRMSEITGHAVHSFASPYLEVKRFPKGYRSSTCPCTQGNESQLHQRLSRY